MRKLIGLLALLTALVVLTVSASVVSAEEASPANEGAPSSVEPGAEEPALAPPVEEAEEPDLAQSLAEGCSANVVCSYYGENFINKYFIDFPCSGEGVTWNFGAQLRFKSARNRCGNKSNWLRLNGTVIACMNPGGDRPSPGAYNEIFIPVNYGAFC
jgi:hypothetical protein